MSRISVVTPEKSIAGAVPAAVTGKVEARAYFSAASDPVHLHELVLGDGGAATFEPHPLDRAGFIWDGEIEAGGHVLPAGSSFIIEHGASLGIGAHAPSSTVLLFAAGHAPKHQAVGGHVHLLPEDRIHRSALKGTSVSGVCLHSDGNCGSSELWLQESQLPGMESAPPDAENATGVHAHAEDEIIFVTRGQIRLGRKLHGPGTALAVTADTLYSFSPGPDGVEFLTFRPARPTGIRFGRDSQMSPPSAWKGVPSPSYLAPRASSTTA